MASDKTKKSPVSRTKAYRIFIGIKSRCLNKNVPCYHRYGGRGITLSLDWLVFDNFWRDMGPTFKEGLSIERIDNSKGYCKENCRWATPKEQARNRRSNRLVEYNGEKKTIAEWAENSGVKLSTFKQRFYVYQWDFQRCLSLK